MVELDDVIQSFYRTPDVLRAVHAFEAWLNATEPSVTELHAFTRMAMVSAEVRSGIEALHPEKPRVVERILKGFDDPEFPRVGDGPPAPEEMDLLWLEFFVTGSLSPVRRIIGVLDEPDVVRAKLTAWLRETGTSFFGKWKFAPLFARCAFPVQFDTMSIGGPMDLDLGVALCARAGKLKFAELPVSLSQNEFVRIAAKSASVWSLRSNALRHPLVAQLCREEATKPGGAARTHLRDAGEA